MRDIIRAATAVTADAVTTYLAVSAGAGEAHPFWAATIGAHGLAAATTMRILIGLVLVAALGVAVEHDGTTITGQTLRVLTAVFAGIAGWNLVVWITA